MVDKITTDNFTANYAVFGEGKKNFVIVPGLSLRPVTPLAGLIEERYSIFKKEYTIYLLDRRLNAPDNYTSLDMARDTIETVKALGIDNAYFFGSSQGGGIIQEIGINFPDMVNALVIASSAAYINDISKVAFDEWVDLAEKRDAIGLANSMTDYCYSKKLEFPNREAYIKSYGNMSEEEFTQFLNLCYGFKSFDVRDRLSEIKAPTFVIGTEGDLVFGADASREIYNKIKEKNSDCELYIYDDTYGHCVYDEAPDYMERVYEFLGKC